MNNVDYTNTDYYAKAKWLCRFFIARAICRSNSAAARWLDMDIDLMRTLGIEMLWDDAGWSKYPSWPIPDSYSTFSHARWKAPILPKRFVISANEYDVASVDVRAADAWRTQHKDRLLGKLPMAHRRRRTF